MRGGASCTELIDWTAGGVRIIIDAPADGFPSLRWLGAAADEPPAGGAWTLPLCEIRAAAQAGRWPRQSGSWAAAISAGMDVVDVRAIQGRP